MAHKKQGGKLTQRKRPQPKYLGVKVTDGQKITSGSVLVRQRGTRYCPGENVRVGRDHTLFSVKDGIVKFIDRSGKKQVSII
jgi:large subunit ribosomal protein L27